MTDRTLTAAFGSFGAELANVRWAVSSIAADGSLVLSGWGHYLVELRNGVTLYADRLSRWQGNPRGQNLLDQHLRSAVQENRAVRIVAADTLDESVVDDGVDTSGIRKKFTPRPELVGKVVHFDGDVFLVLFKASQPAAAA